MSDHVNFIEPESLPSLVDSEHHFRNVSIYLLDNCRLVRVEKHGRRSLVITEHKSQSLYTRSLCITDLTYFELQDSLLAHLIDRFERGDEPSTLCNFTITHLKLCSAAVFMHINRI